MIPEIPYGKDQARTVDWFVKEGKTLLLFECKNKRLNIGGSVIEGDIKQIKKDIGMAVADAVHQLDRTIKLIKSGQKELGALMPVKEFIPVVVLPEFVNENSISLRRIADQILKERYDLEIEFFYHVLDIADLERILPFRNFQKGKLLRNLLKEKENSTEFRFRTFNSFLAYRHGRKIPDNGFLASAFEEIRKRAVEKFFSPKS